VIVTGKMENTVESENLYLFGAGVSQAASVLLRDFGGDGNVASMFGRGYRIGGEGEHVGGHSLSPKARVQGSEFAVRCHEDVYSTPQSDGTPSARYETVERRLVHTYYAFPQDNHPK